MILTRRGLLAGSVLAAGPIVRLGTVRAADGETELRLDVGEGLMALQPNRQPTHVLRYGDAPATSVPHARQGRDTAIRIRNTLTRPTSFRLCGLRGQGSLDDPQAAALARIAPGAEILHRFTPADAGTAWFRAQFDGDDQPAQGLAGVLIVDPASGGPAVDADLAVLLQDWTLDAQNQLAPVGATVVTLGGKPIPSEPSARPGARLRLRLVNGSTTRVMVVACEGVKPMIVAIDGQPSELFAPIRDTVPIGPGARFDVMLDLPRTAGQSVRLVLKGTEKVEGALEPDRTLATITARGDPVDPKPPIAALPPNPALPPMIPLEKSKRAELTINQAGGIWTVNGISGRDWPKQPVLRVKQGDVVTLGFTNASNSLVPLSLYGQAMRLLHPADDGWEPYWRDTVLLPPGSRNHVAFVAATPGRWPIEAGFRAQATGGLRCWFEVVRV